MLPSEFTTVRVELDRSWHAQFIVALCIPVAACILVLWFGDKLRLHLFHKLAAWYLIATVGAAIVMLVRTYLDKRPVLEMRQDGLLAPQVSQDVIPWEGIAAAGIKKIRKSRVVELQLTSEARQSIRLSPAQRIFGPLRPLFRIPRYCIFVDHLDHSIEQVEAMLQMRVQAVKEGTTA